jgi:hypothetical protein
MAGLLDQISGKLIQRVVKPGTIIHSDQWKAHTTCCKTRDNHPFRSGSRCDDTPFISLIFCLALAQYDSNAWVCMPVAGSTKLSEWLTVPWLSCSRELVPQVTMHLQTFSYIFQNNILCKSDIYYGHDRLFIICQLQDPRSWAND